MKRDDTARLGRQPNSLAILGRTGYLRITVATDTAHILYRGIEARSTRSSTTETLGRTRRVCADARAACDPSADVDERGHAAATFRTMNGPIRLVRFVNGQWTCEDLQKHGRVAAAA